MGLNCSDRYLMMLIIYFLKKKMKKNKKKRIKTMEDVECIK